MSYVGIICICKYKVFFSISFIYNMNFWNSSSFIVVYSI
nr:MAG TPA: hypothetical protein [Caudoviricetes sp.]